MFREAVPAPAGRNVAKTLAQSLVIWTLALWIGPVVLVRLLDDVDLRVFDFTPSPAAGWTMLALMSAGGLWSGITMAWRGEGTPLPLDHARRLVVSGPYAYIRNPMAVFGLGQGAAVGLILGSSAIFLYTIAGGALWNWLLRPLEERRLVGQFGADYERYRAMVRCWRPNLAPYRSSASTRCA